MSKEEAEFVRKMCDGHNSRKKGSGRGASRGPSGRGAEKGPNGKDLPPYSDEKREADRVAGFCYHERGGALACKVENCKFKHRHTGSKGPKA